MKYFVTAYTQLKTKPALTAINVCDLPIGTIVLVDEILSSEWLPVIYPTNPKLLSGFVLADYLELYIEPPDQELIRVRNATRSLSDLAQYIDYGGVQYNLCGQFAVLYCAGWRSYDIEAWLDEWKLKALPFFQRIFRGGRSTPTGLSDLAQMLQLFEGYPYRFAPMSEFFNRRGRYVFSPGRLAESLSQYRFIVGCRMESQFGRLRPSGTAHWVVLETCEPQGRGGWVTIYNPAVNGLETYPWDMLIGSLGRTPYGMAVPR